MHGWAGGWDLVLRITPIGQVQTPADGWRLPRLIRHEPEETVKHKLDDVEQGLISRSGRDDFFLRHAAGEIKLIEE